MLRVCPHGHCGCKWLRSRLRTSGILIQPWLAWPSATRSHNVYVEGTSQTHRLNTEVKSYELREGMSQTCGVSANCYKPVARRRVRRGQEQPSVVRWGMPWFTVGQTTPPGWLDASNMAAMSVETDRDRQQRKAVLARLADVVSAHTCCLFLALFFSIDEPGDGWRWIFHWLSNLLFTLEHLCLKRFIQNRRRDFGSLIMILWH